MTGFADQPFMMALLLIGGHAAADFGLQSAYVADGKSRHGEKANPHWLPVLFAHAAMHGAIVGLVTGYAILGFWEILAHFVIDDMKCAKRFGYEADQALHYACKAAWFVAALTLHAHGVVSR